MKKYESIHVNSTNRINKRKDFEGKAKTTSNIGAAVGLQSTYIAIFPLSGCNALGFPSSACKNIK